MNRRTFNKTLGSAAAILAASPLDGYAGRRISLDRIAISTVNFRGRFESTRSKDRPSVGDELTLLKIPEYYADRFGLHNVEYWSPHFESIEPAYLMEIKASLKKNKSTLINIQFDEDYQIGSPDASKRKESLELALKWVDVAKTLGSGGIRVNPGNGEVGYAIESLKVINESAKKKGIILMVENHFGMEMDPDVHLKIVKETGENTYTLPDFGNYSDEARYESLAKIMPFAYQVSAKTIEFDENMDHKSFDFDRCMKMVVDSGFSGIYSVEQWSPDPPKVSDEAIADWMIEKVKNYSK